MSDLFSLSGKTAVVTGGAGLLGKSICKTLWDQGATVIATDINTAAGDAFCKPFNSSRMLFRPLDIIAEESILQCIANIESSGLSIDIWINNAYPRTADWGVRLESVVFESWRENIDMHLNGYFLCSQKIALHMKNKARKGSIINLGSIYGIVAPDFSIYEGTAMTMPAAYAAIKGGIINLTRYFSSYFGKAGIRVNAISPGGIFDNQDSQFVERYCAKTPLDRMGTPSDVAAAAAFLSSDAAGFITGHNLVVDGGWSIV